MPFYNTSTRVLRYKDNVFSYQNIELIVYTNMTCYNKPMEHLNGHKIHNPKSTQVLIVYKWCMGINAAKKQNKSKPNTTPWKIVRTV